MTSTKRPPSGTYLVLDPTVAASIGDLLATAGRLLDSSTPAPAPDERANVAPAPDLSAEVQRMQRLLDDTNRLLDAQTSQLAQAREDRDAATTELEAARAEIAELSSAAESLTDTHDELTKKLAQAEAALAEEKARPSAGTATGRRTRDRRELEDFISRVERDAKSKSKTVSDTMRVIAKALAAELDAIYGTKVDA